jgi:hypothetical protein
LIAIHTNDIIGIISLYTMSQSSYEHSSSSMSLTCANPGNNMCLTFNYPRLYIYIMYPESNVYNCYVKKKEKEKKKAEKT